MFKVFLILSIGAGLLACSSVNTISVSSDPVAITDQYESKNEIDSLVNPYRDSLKDEMMEIIAHASEDFTKGRPGGSLNNWAADAVISHHTKHIRHSVPVICLLNVGGLRNPISKGDVTVGDIFKLMPFDNEVVWVEMPIAEVSNIEKYLQNTGGEPISGAKVKAGKMVFDRQGGDPKSFWILTSDYLMNGGDKMTFFENRLSYEGTGILLRDTFLEVAKYQKKLSFNDEIRMSF